MARMRRLKSSRELFDYLEEQGRRLEKVYARIAEIASDMEVCTSQRVNLRQLVRKARAGLDFEVPDTEIEIKSQGRTLFSGGWSGIAQTREEYERHRGKKDRAIFPRVEQLRVSLEHGNMALIRAKERELPQTLEELADYSRRCDNYEYSVVLIPLYRKAAKRLAITQAA